MATTTTSPAPAKAQTNPTAQTGAGTAQGAAVTQAPSETEPDPYVWVPADNPLLGQTPRSAPPVAKAPVVPAEEAKTQSWSHVLIGLGVGTILGAAVVSLGYGLWLKARG